MNNYIGLICILSLSASVVEAQSEDYQFYLSGSVNRAFGEVNAEDMNNRMANLGYNANAEVYGQDRNAWDFALGYRVTNYLDLQLGYSDLGKVKTRLSGNVTDINDYLNSANLVHPRSADGITLALRGRYYLHDRFFLYARAGVLQADSRYIADAEIENAKRSKKEKSFFFGLGYEYEWSPRWSLHLSGDVYRVEDESIKVAGIGVAYRFGAKSNTSLAPIEQPHSSPEIKPEPVVTQKSEVEVPAEIELAIRFDPDSAIIKTEFNAEIERLAIFMKEHPNIQILLEGHTDNQGDDQHNQMLSQRRVDAVMTELVNHFGIVAQRLSAHGYGELRPVADNNTADGRAKNRRVIARTLGN